MDKKALFYIVCGAGLGYALGYTICWWHRPMPQLMDKQTGGSKVKTAANILLDTGSAIDKMKPALHTLAEGDIPRPKDIYALLKEVT
jgi:hypothetical protein